MWGDELNISTYRCSYNQRQMALSNESIKFYCQAKLCDLAILNSPTSYDDTELTYYLVDELRRHGYTNFYHLVTGVPFVLNSGYLELVRETCDDEDFKYILSLIILLKNAEETLKNIYNYDSQALTRNVSKDPTQHIIRKIKGKDSLYREQYRERDITSKNNSIPFDIDYEEYSTHLYYKYFIRKTSTFIPGDWTFFKGFTRDEEKDYIWLVLEGYIKPTNPEVQKAWELYYKAMLKEGITVYREIEPLLEDEREAILMLNDCSKIKYINYYSIGFIKFTLEDFEKLLVPYIYSKDVKLSLTNLTLGLGGEFSLDGKGTPIKLRLVDGTVKTMYRVSKANYTYKNFNFGYLNDCLKKVGLSIGDSALILTSDVIGKLRPALRELDRMGVYFGKD